jgi:hypothetical protein
MEIQRKIDTLKPGFGFASAACGSDILFLEAMLDAGAEVVVWDPKAAKHAAEELPALGISEDPYEAAVGASCAVVCTEWPELRELDLGHLGGGMAERVLVAEVAVAGLAGGQLSTVRAVTPSRYPSVERDLAVIVDEATPSADIQASIGRHGGPLLRRTVLFDVYRGRPLAETDKSLAWRLTFAGDERTLTEAEVDDAVASIAAGLAADVGGRLRS